MTWASRGWYRQTDPKSTTSKPLGRVAGLDVDLLAVRLRLPRLGHEQGRVGGTYSCSARAERLVAGDEPEELPRGRSVDNSNLAQTVAPLAVVVVQRQSDLGRAPSRTDRNPNSVLPRFQDGRCRQSPGRERPGLLTGALDLPRHADCLPRQPHGEVTNIEVFVHSPQM